MRLGLVALVATVALAGCASSPPPRVEYLPPSGAPANIKRSVVRLPQDMAWNQVLDRLQQSPLRIDHADRSAGIMVATYQGDPEPFVDCGWILKYSPESLERVPGAAPQAAFERIVDDRRLSLRRDLDLHGRMVLQFRPQGRQTIVNAESTYVLAKKIRVEDGSVRGQDYEIVSFGTGDRGEFTKGTVCQPTGKFELAALEALPVVASGADGPARSTVVTDAPVDGAPELVPPEIPASLDCAGVEWTFCRALEVTEAYRDANRSGDVDLGVTTVDGSRTLTDGESLALDIRLPGFEAYLHVAYLQRNGSVGHVIPGSDRRWPAKGRRYVQDTDYAIAPPFGREMILAVATYAPLFAEPRPRFEPAEAYLDALARRLAELEARNPGGRIAASHRFVTTQARSGPIAGRVAE